MTTKKAIKFAVKHLIYSDKYPSDRGILRLPQYNDPAKIFTEIERIAKEYIALENRLKGCEIGLNTIKE